MCSLVWPITLISTEHKAAFMTADDAWDMDAAAKKLQIKCGATHFQTGSTEDLNSYHIFKVDIQD